MLSPTRNKLTGTNNRFFKRFVRPLALLALPALVCGAALFLTSASQLPRGQFAAFGPANFVRTGGKPAPATATFTVLNPRTDYFVRIHNGGEDGQFGKVSSAVVTLNGSEVAGPQDFSQGAQTIEKPVTLAASNTLSVELRSAPGSGVTLQVVGTDNDPPAITATAEPPANAEGWHNTNVTVAFNCSDATSGVASCTDPVQVQTEGAGQTVTGTAVDRAQNSSTASLTLNVDKTAPVINLTSPGNGVTVSAANIPVTGTATDSLSGLKTLTCNGAAAVVSGSAFTCNQALNLGQNTIAVEATDAAGNKSNASLTVIRQTEPPPAPSPILNPRITPDVVFLGESKAVTVTATIPYDPQAATPQVTLERVDADGRVIGTEGALVDDGSFNTTGDLYKRDGQFSFRKTYAPQKEEKMLLRISLRRDGQDIHSQTLPLQFRASVSDQQINGILGAHVAALQTYNANVGKLGQKGASDAALEQLRKDPSVEQAGEMEAGLWVIYKSGITGYISFLGPEFAGGGAARPPARGERPTLSVRGAPPRLGGGDADDADTDDADTIQARRAIVLSPFLHEALPDLVSSWDRSAELAALLGSVPCPPLNVTYLHDEAAGVEAFKNLDRYGIIVIRTHGVSFYYRDPSQPPDPTQVVMLPDVSLLTGTPVALNNFRTYLGDLLTGRLILGATPRQKVFYSVRPSFIEYYTSGRFPNSLVFLGACDSLREVALANVFLARGAKTVLGWDKLVHKDFDAATVIDFFHKFLGPPAAPVKDAYKEVTDPKEPHASLEMYGSNALKVEPTGGLLNGGFEKDYWGFWDTSWFPTLEPQFGGFRPQGGEHMAVLSTSNRPFITNTSGISQKICLPEDAEYLEFDWNLLTEDYGVCTRGTREPTNDGFLVRIGNADKYEIILSTHVKDQCEFLNPIDFKFNNFSTKATGWRPHLRDLGDFAKSVKGKPVTLSFSVSDDWCCGIHYWGDTAVLIDNVRVIRESDGGGNAHAPVAPLRLNAAPAQAPGARPLPRRE